VIIGDITLEQVERMFIRMGLAEPVLLPWYEDDRLVGLITGYIESPEQAFLEHFVILPEAKHKLRFMQLAPKIAEIRLRERGIKRITLYIVKDDPRRSGLDAWARRGGYHQYGESESRVWYVRHLTEETAP